MDQDLAALSSKFKLAQDELTALKERETQRKQQILEAEQQREKLSDELGRVNRTLDARQNEYDLLKSMIENFEGFPESLKFLSSQWRKDVPVLSDLLDVQEEYKSVIEQYLEPYLTYFVVSDVSEAGEAIRLLGGAQKGKANFFLLNRIKSEANSTLSIPWQNQPLNV